MVEMRWRLEDGSTDDERWWKLRSGVGAEERERPWFSGFRSVIRRKQVGSVHCRSHPQLARKLSAVDLVGIGNSSFSNFQVILIMVLINDS